MKISKQLAIFYTDLNSLPLGYKM